MKKLLMGLVLVAGVLGIVLAFKPTAKKVNAQVTSRPEWTGYYTGVNDTNFDTVVPSQTRFDQYGFPPPNAGTGGLENAFTSADNFLNLAQFVTLMRNMLFDTSWTPCVWHRPVVPADRTPYEDPCYQRKMDAQWASYVINTQLGDNGMLYGFCNNALAPDPWDNWFCGLDSARNRFSQWEAIINYYAGQGWIQWHAPVNFAPNHLNTLVGWYGEDSFRFTQPAAESAWSLVFNSPPSASNPAGSQYIIKKWCGNITGEATPLVPPPSGSFVSANCNVVTGWAFDPKNYTNNYQVQVRVYRDGRPGFGGTLVRTVTANQATPTGAPIPGNHGFTADISPWADVVPHTYYIYAAASDAAGNPTSQGFELAGSPKTVTGAAGGGCIQPACSPLTIIASDGTSQPEPSDPFSVQVGFTFGGAAATSPSGFTITLTLPPPAINGTQSAHVTVPAGGTGAMHTFTGVVQNNAGVYNGTWRITPDAGGAATNCPSAGPATYIVANKPVSKTFGNDVQAGGNFAANASRTCAAPAAPGATIIGYTSGSGSAYKGATAQYAAFALGAVNGYASAGTRASSPTQPKDLTFANTSAGVFGGNSNITHCVPNYMAEFLTTSPSSSSPTINGFPAGNSTRYVNGNATLISGTPGGTLTIPAGTHATIYIDGNLVINTNIVYAGADLGGWANRSQIPSLTVVVRGNIFINKLVTRLDGVFIAQPGIVGNGTINTCVVVSGNSGNALPVIAASVFDNCNSKLTVNGAFIAQRVKLLRVNGSLSKTTLNEPRGGLNTAEEFNFSPEAYLALPDCAIPQNCKSSAKADAITSLPPIL